MWKPVRLQGVGAASSIHQREHPARGQDGSVAPEVNCLFGLALNGTPYTLLAVATPSYDSDRARTVARQPVGITSRAGQHPQVDRLPLEGTVGWDATVNGNLARAVAGADADGSLRRSRNYGAFERRELPRAGSSDIRSEAARKSAFPTGTTLLTASRIAGLATGPIRSRATSSATRRASMA
jgi:hypothetical protein